MIDLKRLTKPYGELTGKKEAVNKETEAKITTKQVVKKPISVKERSDIRGSAFSLPTPNIGAFPKLFDVVQKNIQLLIRSRTSSLIVLLGPLLIIFLVGYAFNTSSLYDIKIATYSDSYSELTDSLVGNLRDQQYSTVKVESREDCIDGVKLANYHICAIFPSDMKVTNEAENIIQFFVDKSRMNLAYIIANTIFSKIEESSAELSMGMTEDLLDTIDYTKSVVTSEATRVNELKASNSDTTIRLRTIGDNFNALDLEVNDSQLNITMLKEELDEVKEENNISSGAFRYVDSMLEDIGMGITTLGTKINTVKSTREQTISDISNINQKLGQDLENVRGLESSMKSITTDIGKISVTKAENIVSPIKTEIEPLSQKTTHLNAMFPTMLVLIVMFVSLLLSSTIIIREKLSSAYFRNFITPTHDLVFMLGNYLTNILIVGAQMLIIIAVASYYFKGELNPVLGSLALSLFILSSVFILCGIFIGYIFKSEETSTLAAISAGSLMLFFSNTVLPIETMPGYIANIVRYNPFVLGESILKKLMLFNVELGVVIIPILMLLCFVGIFFAFGFVARELTKRKFS